MFSNNLTPAQSERLALLAEEMGEAIQVIGKILRHGYESCSPNDPNHIENRSLLEKELGDVTLAIWLMTQNYDVHESSIDVWKEKKRMNVWKYLHHQSEAK